MSGVSLQHCKNREYFWKILVGTAMKEKTDYRNTKAIFSLGGKGTLLFPLTSVQNIKKLSSIINCNNNSIIAIILIVLQPLCYLQYYHKIVALTH